MALSKFEGEGRRETLGWSVKNSRPQIIKDQPHLTKVHLGERASLPLLNPAGAGLGLAARSDPTSDSLTHLHAIAGRDAAGTMLYTHERLTIDSSAPDRPTIGTSARHRTQRLRPNQEESGAQRRAENEVDWGPDSYRPRPARINAIGDPSREPPGWDEADAKSWHQQDPEGDEVELVRRNYGSRLNLRRPAPQGGRLSAAS